MTKGAVKSFDVGIEVGPVRRDDIGSHPKTEQEAHQGRREIASLGTAHQAGIIVKGEHARQAVQAEKLSHYLEERLGIEIATHFTV